MGRSYLIVIVWQAVAAAAALATLRWLATYVEPDTFGRYSLFQSVISAGALFLVSWPNAALLRFGREEWTTYGRVGVTFGARVFLFATCVTVAIALAWVFDPWLRTFLQVDRSPFAWIAAGVVITPAAELAIYLNQAIGRTEVYGYSPAITRLGFFVGAALIPLIGTGAEWTYLAGWLLASTAAAAAFATLTIPPVSFRDFRLHPDTVVTLVKYSWTLPLAALSTYVVNWIDSWVIRQTRGVASVGVYTWAYQATAIASLAFAPIAVVLTPRVIDARLKADSLRVTRYVGAILTTVLVLSVCVALGLVFVFPVLNGIVSPAYAPAYPVILFLLAALPFQLLAYLLTPLANAYERLLPRIVFVSVVIAVVNTVGDLLLVSRIGIVGAAIATATAFATGGILLVIVIRAQGIAFAPLWKYMLPAVVVLPCVLVLHWAGPLVGALAIAIVATGAASIGLVYKRHRPEATAASVRSNLRAWWDALTLADRPARDPARTPTSMTNHAAE